MNNNTDPKDTIFYVCIAIAIILILVWIVLTSSEFYDIYNSSAEPIFTAGVENIISTASTQ